ncbi:FliH/SctL family protein [Ralstonia sp. 22111]|uniref:FliH/SctL family protein n=1 Tax=Ralstonia TaxID=48736 RepID=UPI003D9A029A
MSATHLGHSGQDAAPREDADHMGAAVLRDIPVQEVPRLLTRRRTAIHTNAVASERLIEATAQDYETGWLTGQRDGTAHGREEGYRAGFQSGREEGYQQGLKEGRVDGLAEAQLTAAQAVEGRLEQLDRLLSAMPEAILQRLDESEDEMVALCFEVICRVIGDRAADPKVVQDMIQNNVRRTSTRLVAVHVHPADLERLRSDAELNTWIVRRSAQQGVPVDWIADDRVELGGCILQSPQGSLDARLEAQLESVREILSRDVATSSEGSA